MRARLIGSMLAALMALGCEEGEPEEMIYVPTDAGPGVERVCMDEDNDGFGMNCVAGRDCDDNDADSTDECYRCVTPNEDCPCEPGTRPTFCDPPDERVEGGTLVCDEGTRYCRDGFWSDCERIEQYTIFVPDP